MTTAHQGQLFPAAVQSRETDERYTPRWIFDTMAAKFDIDVCAPPGGVPWIPARRYYTAHDDGLAQPWHGLVWCNPPFSNPGPWAARFATHPDGVMLFPFSLDAAWVNRLLAAVPLIIRLDRMRFEHPEHTGCHVPVGVALTARGVGVPLIERLWNAGHGAALRPIGEDDR